MAPGPQRTYSAAGAAGEIRSSRHQCRGTGRLGSGRAQGGLLGGGTSSDGVRGSISEIVAVQTKALRRDGSLGGWGETRGH